MANPDKRPIFLGNSGARSTEHGVRVLRAPLYKLCWYHYLEERGVVSRAFEKARLTHFPGNPPRHHEEGATLAICVLRVGCRQGGHHQGLDLVEGSEGMWEMRPMFFPRILDQLADVKPRVGPGDLGGLIGVQPDLVGTALLDVGGDPLLGRDRHLVGATTTVLLTFSLYHHHLAICVLRRQRSRSPAGPRFG